MQEQQSGSLKSEMPEAEMPLAIILWGIVFGGSSSALKTWMDVPAPIAVAIAAVLAQLTYLAIPAKRREYDSLMQWARDTMAFAAASALGVYLVGLI